MDALMAFEVGQLGERHIARFAFEGPFSGVNPQMQLQFTGLTEGFSALLTTEGHLTCVSAFVISQSTLEGESSGTVFALKRPLSCVDAQMALQITGVEKGFLAYVAAVRSTGVDA